MSDFRKRLAAVVVLFLILVAPNHPQMVGWQALAALPLELPLVLLLLVGFGGTAFALMIKVLLVGAMGFVLLLRLADIGTFVAYERAFNLMADLHFTPAVWMLLVGSVGLPLAVATVIAGLLAFVAVMMALWWAAGVWARGAPKPGVRIAAIILLIPAAGLVTADVQQAKPSLIPGEAFAARVGVERSQLMVNTYQDMREFRTAARLDPMLTQGPFFTGLKGRDVIIIYVESYGRSSFINPLYAPTHTHRLATIEQSLKEAGLAMRSGWTTAPMTGGQSWLAHGSVAMGLWLHNQPRYRAMLASGRQSLFHYANRSGFRTVAIKPAHIMGWPEGDAFGFEAIYNAADLGYEGPPFNWVTMPDQFTLKAFERLELQQSQRPPLFAQIALISSHAPWVPIPELIGWDEIGGGERFAEWAFSGDPPEVVWRDPDRIRDQFRQAIDYSLEVVGSWAERQATDPPLMIILGDHEPAGFVAGVDSYDVPIHIVGPPDLVARFAPLGWVEGMVPSAESSPQRMDLLRDILLEAL